MPSSATIRLVIPVETKVRELDAKLLFGLAAAEAGYEVYIGSQESALRELPRLHPCVYVDKSFASTKRNHFTRLKGQGSRIAAWDEEGLVYFDDETYRAFRMDQAVLDMVDVVLAWGEAQADVVRSGARGGTRVTVPGHPRIDLLRPELRDFFKSEVEALRQEHGRMILVNTAFPFANHFLGDSIVEDLYARYPIAGLKPQFFEDWKATQAKGFDVFQQALPALIEAFPDHRIILRPHPSENWETWRVFEKRFPRVTVSGEGNVVQWLLASEVMVHFDCLTGIEAFCSDIPSIVFRPFDSPGYEQHLPNQLSIKARSIPEMLAWVEKAVSGTFPVLREDPERFTLAHQHLANLDGSYAFDRCVAALNGLVPDTRSPAIPEPPPDPLRRAWRAWLAIYRPLRDRLRKDPYDQQKFGSLTLEEMTSRHALFFQTLKRFNKVVITPHSDRLFTLSTPSR